MSNAIIVLGWTLNNNGTPKPILRDRVKRAVELWKQKEAPYIIMSGRWGWIQQPKPPNTEAGAMVSDARSQGVLDSALIKEEESQDTIGNAYFTKRNILIPRRWSNITIVTSDFHSHRAHYIFQKICGPDYTVKMESVPSQEKREADETRIMQVIKRWLEPIQNETDIENLVWQKHPAYASHRFTEEEIKEWIA